MFYEMKYLRKMMQCIRKSKSKVFPLQPPIHQSLAQSHYGTTGRQAADRGGGNFGLKWSLLKFFTISCCRNSEKMRNTSPRPDLGQGDPAVEDSLPLLLPPFHLLQDSLPLLTPLSISPHSCTSLPSLMVHIL